jgi:hypothetical protein
MHIKCASCGALGIYIKQDKCSPCLDEFRNVKHTSYQGIDYSTLEFEPELTTITLKGDIVQGEIEQGFGDTPKEYHDPSDVYFYTAPKKAVDADQ